MWLESIASREAPVALELFSGTGRFAAAWRSGERTSRIPIFEWGVKSFPELDLTSRAAQRRVRGWLRRGLVIFVWLGTPCTSFSRARDIGGAIRSLEYPLGLPHISGIDLEKLSVGNLLAAFSASVLMLCLRLGIPGVVENPGGSKLWNLPCFRDVAARQGSSWSTHDYCMDGTPWRKRTGLLSVNCDLSSCCRKCGGRGICSRSGGAHEQLLGNTGGIARTLLAEPYPKVWCRRIARHVGNVFLSDKGHSLGTLFCGQ